MMDFLRDHQLSGERCADRVVPAPAFILPRLGTWKADFPNPSRSLPQRVWRRRGVLDCRAPLLEAWEGEGWGDFLDLKPRILLVGCVGSGKTFLLRNIRKNNFDPYLPNSSKNLHILYVSLNSDRRLLSSSEEPPTLLPGRGARRSADDEALSAGGCWVLVDGLDIEGDPTLLWLRGLVENYPHNRYLVATRREHREILPDCTILRLLPWSRRMVEQWADLQVDAGRLGRRELFMDLVETCLEISDLPLTPLLLSLLARMAQSPRQFSQLHAELYSSYIRFLLERSRTERGIDRFLDTDLKLDLLAILAVKMENAGGKLERMDAAACITERMKEIGLQPDAAGEVLQEIGIRSGVLNLEEDGEVTFLCPGIRHYLEAWNNVRHPRGNSRWFRTAELVSDEARFFLVAMGGDTELIVSELLEGEDDLFSSRLLAAARCTGAGRYTPVEYRIRVRTRVLRLFWYGPYELLQQEALTALCWMADEELVAHFKKALNSDMDFIRIRAIMALARMRAREAVPCLHGLLEDRSWKVRMQAADALGRIGDRTGWEKLASLLGDVHWQVRLAAASALGWVGARKTAPLLRASLLEGYHSSQYNTAALFERLGLRREAEFPRKAADDQDLAVRIRLAEALWRMGERPGREILLRLLEESGEYARLAAASVLAKEGFATALDELRRGCESADSAMRYRAVLSSAYVPLVCGVEFQPDERQVMAPLVEILTVLLEDSAWKVRGAAAIALGSFGRSEWARPLIPLLDDGDHFVGANAAVALGLAGCREATDALIAVLEDGKRAETVRGYAGRALGALGVTRARRLLLDHLHEGGILLRLNVARALGEVGDAEGMSLLLERAVKDEDPAVRNAAFSAAYEICRREGVVLDQEYLRGLPQHRKRIIADAVSLLQRYI